jgi:hypothetical protein
VFGFNQRTGNVFVEFEYHGKDWVDGSPYPQAKLQSDLTGNSDSGSYADKTVEDLTHIGNFWTRHKITWDAGSVLSSKDWGSHDIKLTIDDEDDNSQTFTQPVKINLEPNKFLLTNTTSIFGDDSTPKISWTLDELLNNNQIMNPVTITVGSSTTTQIGYLINDVVWTNISYINFNNTDGKAGMTCFDSTKGEFSIDAPTMSSGENNYTIDLKCEDL